MCTSAGSRPPSGKPFEHVLLIGIGGSALGPQFVADALGSARDQMEIFFFDNTDPDGFDRVFAKIGDGLEQTLVVVISKSGGTKETRNGMLEAKARFEKAGLDFGKHAVAVTGAGSELDKYAETERLAGAFPDVRLDRRPHLGHERGRPFAGGAARASTRTLSSRGRRRWTRTPACRNATRTPPCCSP